MKTTMEKFGFQLIILAFCTGATFPTFVIDDNKRNYSDSTGYQLVKRAKGIELYEKWYKINATSMAREVKAVYSVQASIESAAALIENEANAVRWNKSTSQYKIIATNENSWVSYIQYDLPWPVDNQDCVLQHTVSLQKKNQIVIDFKSVEHEIFPAAPNISRITDIKGQWIFKETPSGTQVQYSITTLPSPTLPRWVTDPIVRNNLIDTMDEFRNILEGSKN